MIRVALGFTLAAFLTASSLAVPSAAQTYPDRPVRLIVPFPPGGAADILARLLAEGLSKHWDRPVVPDYRPGGGTIVGTDAVARAVPDGYTLGIVVTSFVINPGIRQDLPYSMDDFKGVTQIGEAPIVLLAHPDSPAETIDDVVSEARSRPDQVAYASPGVGTATHMAGELFARLADIELLHVPYAGLAQALPDVLGGRVPLLFDIWHSARPHVEASSLKVIAVASLGGVPGHPGFESLAERYPGFSALSIQGVVAPAGTPDGVIDKVSEGMRAVITSREFAERMNELGVQPVGSTPRDFERFLDTEVERWSRIAKEAGIRIAD
jgi:tripartite-type tricarboxylate transporter receptor subunit TctC